MAPSCGGYTGGFARAEKVKPCRARDVVTASRVNIDGRYGTSKEGVKQLTKAILERAAFAHPGYEKHDPAVYWFR